MEGRQDPDCRRAFPWDAAAWDKELLAFVRAAMAVRHAQPALRHGAFELLAADGGAVAYARTLAGSPTVVTVLNADTAGGALAFTLPAGVTRLDAASTALASSARVTVDPTEAAVTVEFGPRSLAILVGS